MNKERIYVSWKYAFPVEDGGRLQAGWHRGCQQRVHRLTATFLLYVRALILIVDDSFLRTGYLVMFIIVGWWMNGGMVVGVRYESTECSSIDRWQRVGESVKSGGKMWDDCRGVLNCWIRRPARMTTTTATTAATHFPRSAAVRGPTSDSSATLPHRAPSSVLPRLPVPPRWPGQYLGWVSST